MESTTVAGTLHTCIARLSRNRQSDRLFLVVTDFARGWQFFSDFDSDYLLGRRARSCCHPAGQQDSEKEGCVGQQTMMSWWSGRKEDDQNNHNLHLESSKMKQSKKTPNRRRLGRHTAAAEASVEDEESISTTASRPSSMMHVAETVSGIEVSFSSDDNALRSLPDERNEGTVVSLREQLYRRRKVHRAQYRVTESSTATSIAALSKTASLSVDALVPSDLSSGTHRVPLFAKTLKKAKVKAKPGKGSGALPVVNYHQALQLLQSHDVSDEAALLQEEVRNLATETHALGSDRTRLAQRSATLLASNQHHHSKPTPAGAGGPTAPASSSSAEVQFWDVHRLLASEKVPSSGLERSRLQEQRGLCLTVSLHNPLAREAFLAKCGSTASFLRTAMQRSPDSPDGGVVVSIRPETCRDGGAASTIQHLSLLAGGMSSNEAGGFFMSRDGSGGGSHQTHHSSPSSHSKAYYWGHLPDRLFRRMKNAGLDPKHHACDLLYLSTGPMGAYYAEFRSGECWWGSTAEDTEFDSLCCEWDVSRVAFGACNTLVDSLGQKHHSTSWIVIGRDGRVAWKNLPSRLHNKLERRLASENAPAEVTLGPGGSYFIRFVDGAVDYCLPAVIARVCRSIEAKGLTITSISLHPELSHDFIVRHT